MVSNMDYLSSYTATLLEQSRFYFPPMAAMRNALQEARPPIGLPIDGTPAGMAASLAPFMELGLIHRPGGPREREIPLDLSMKNIRQTPDSTADDDIIILEHRRNNARNHIDQMAAYVAAGKMALANKFALSLQAQGQGLGDPFIFSNNLLQTIPATGAAQMATSQGVYRCPQGQQGAEGNSAFLTPPASLHAAICGGLNGFCLDPHRCRMASLSAVASSSSNVARHHAAVFQGAASYALYERQMAKLMPNAATEFVGPSNGFSNLHMPPTLMPVSSSVATTTSSTPTSSDMLKNPFQVNGAEGYLAPFSVPSLPSPYHHHNHSHPKEVPTSCSCYLPKPYPMSCSCCYPARGYEGQPAGNGFPCCQRPDSVATFPESKDKSKREQTPGVTTPTGGRSHHSHTKHSCKNAAGHSNSKTVATSPSNTSAERLSCQSLTKDGAPQTDGRPPSPCKPQPEGGRWIPHPHSHHSHKDKSGPLLVAACPDIPPGEEKSKANLSAAHVQPVPLDGQASTPTKTPDRTASLIPKAEPNIPNSTPVEKTSTACLVQQSEFPRQGPTTAVKLEVERQTPSLEKLSQKPNIDRWMLTPPTVVKTEVETGSKLAPYLVPPQSWNSVGQDGHLVRVWEHQAFASESTSGIVTPVTVKKTSLTVGLPASPAEGCAPLSVDLKSDSSTDRDTMVSGKIPQFLQDIPMDGNPDSVNQPWKVSIKRSASDLGLVTSKKKRKKDVIVISMREEHQGNRTNQVLMKSVKRQLNGELVNGFSELMQSKENLTSASAMSSHDSDSSRTSHHKFLTGGQPHDEKQKLCSKVVPGVPNGSVSAKSSFYSCHNVAESRLPPVGVTLVKTPNGANQYKSSVLSGSNEDTSAMLRLYYEQQKQRLQNGYSLMKESNPSSEEVRSNAIASSSSVPSSDPNSKRKRTQSKSRHHKRSYDRAVLALPKSKDGCLPQQQQQQQQQQQRRLQPSFHKHTEEEDARDGDDEREDDIDEDEERGKCEDAAKCGQNKDESLNRTDANAVHSKEHRGTTNENIENEKNANNHILSPASSIMEPMSPTTSLDTPNISVTAVASRVESTKRLMINKALGETMLHRAARLGYLDVLSYCLETQAIGIDARDNAGYTPLHECCSRGHLEIARQLLQHGADPNASAAGGIRPIHDAIENDQLEIVRLLLSYGADPGIATYSGLKPVKIARSQIMLEFLKGYLADVNGESESSILPWQFRGSTAFFDPWPTGYDPLLELPSEDESCNDVNGDDDVDNAAALIFEVSDKPHIPTYRVPTSRRNGSGMLSFCLLQDVLNQTAMDRDAFLSCYPDIQVETMPCHEFESRAKCTQLMVDVGAALEACPASPWVELVHWDDTLRDILDIERVAIPRMEV